MVLPSPVRIPTRSAVYAQERRDNESQARDLLLQRLIDHGSNLSAEVETRGDLNLTSKVMVAALLLIDSTAPVPQRSDCKSYGTNSAEYNATRRANEAEIRETLRQRLPYHIQQADFMQQSNFNPTTKIVIAAAKLLDELPSNLDLVTGDPDMACFRSPSCNAARSLAQHDDPDRRLASSKQDIEDTDTEIPVATLHTQRSEILDSHDDDDDDDTGLPLLLTRLPLKREKIVKSRRPAFTSRFITVNDSPQPHSPAVDSIHWPTGAPLLLKDNRLKDYLPPISPPPALPSLPPSLPMLPTPPKSNPRKRSQPLSSSSASFDKDNTPIQPWDDTTFSSHPVVEIRHLEQVAKRLVAKAKEMLEPAGEPLQSRKGGSIDSREVGEEDKKDIEWLGDLMIDAITMIESRTNRNRLVRKWEEIRQGWAEDGVAE